MLWAGWNLVTGQIKTSLRLTGVNISFSYHNYKEKSITNSCLSKRGCEPTWRFWSEGLEAFCGIVVWVGCWGSEGRWNTQQLRTDRTEFISVNKQDFLKESNRLHQFLHPTGIYRGPWTLTGCLGQKGATIITMKAIKVIIVQCHCPARYLYHLLFFHIEFKRLLILKVLPSLSITCCLPLHVAHSSLCVAPFICSSRSHLSTPFHAVSYVWNDIPLPGHRQWNPGPTEVTRILP